MKASEGLDRDVRSCLSRARTKMGNREQRKADRNDNPQHYRPPRATAYGIREGQQREPKCDRKIPEAEQYAAGRHAPIVAGVRCRTVSRGVRLSLLD